MTYMNVFPTSKHRRLLSRYRWAWVVKVPDQPAGVGVARTRRGATRAARKAAEFGERAS